MATSVFSTFTLSRSLGVESSETKNSEEYVSFLSECWFDTRNLFVEQDSTNHRVISYITNDPNPQCDTIIALFERHESKFKYVIIEHSFCGETVTNFICQSSLIKVAPSVDGFKQINGIVIPNKESKISSLSDRTVGVNSHSLISAIITVDNQKNMLEMTVDDVTCAFNLEVMREFITFSPNRFVSSDKNVLSVILSEHLDSSIIDENYNIIVSAVFNDIKSISHVNKSAGDIRAAVRTVVDKIMDSHDVCHTTGRFNRAYSMQKDKTFRSVGELFRTSNTEMYTTWHKQYLLEHITDALEKTSASNIRQDMIAKIYAPLVKAYLFLDFVFIGDKLYHKSRSTHFLRPVGQNDLLANLRTITNLIEPSDIGCAQSYENFKKHINQLKYPEKDSFLRSFFTHEYPDAESLLNETRGVMAWDDCVTEVIDTEQPDGKRRLHLNIRAGRVEDFVTFKCGVALGFNIETEQIDVDDEIEQKCLDGIKEWFRKMFVDKETRQSVKLMIGALLIGDNLSKLIVFLDGIGNNSKSALLEILKLLGDYYAIISVSMLMSGQQKKDSANASPDVLKLKGRRLAVIMEPGPNILFDPGSLKSKSSRDDDKARPLYGSSDISFKAMYTIWIACNNAPKIENADLQSLRRALIVPMNSVFLEHGAPTEVEHQYANRTFHADVNFNTYIGRWRPTFGRLMVKWCKKYMDNGTNFNFSKEILQVTDFYRHSNSEMMTFARKYIEPSDNPEDGIPYTTLAASYNVATLRQFGNGSIGNMGKFLSLIKTFVFGKYKKDGIDCNIWDDGEQMLRGHRLADV